MFDTLQEIAAGLRRNKLRTALTGCSVSMGIFLLIVLLGAGNGLIHAFESNSGNMALDVFHVWPGTTSLPYDGLAKGRNMRFDNNDIRLAESAFPGRVAAATGQVSQSGVTFRHGKEQATGSLAGVYDRFAEMNKVKLAAGRFISRADLAERRKVAVIGRKAAARLFGNETKAVGRYLNVDSIVFRVAGVYADQGQMGETKAYVPFTTLQLICKKGTNVESLLLRTRDLDTEESDSAFQADLRRALAARHRFSPNDEQAVWTYNSTTGAKERAEGMNILRNALWVVGLLTLLSGVVGVSNIMLITVKERTHEFGIRKALGAKPWSILRSVLLESVLITGLFGYAGLVLGVAATEYMSVLAGRSVITVADMEMTVFLDPTVDLGVALRALLVLIAAGLAAGFFPARKAVRVKPIEALRGGQK